MTEVHHTHPAILGISHIDTIPTMVFVHRAGMVVIGFQRQVLDTTLLNESTMFIDNGFCPTPTCVNATGNGGIKSDSRAVYCRNASIPSEIDVAWMPSPIAHTLASAKGRTAKVINPFLGGRTANHDSVMGSDK